MVVICGYKEVKSMIVDSNAYTPRWESGRDRAGVSAFLQPDGCGGIDIQIFGSKIGPARMSSLTARPVGPKREP